MAKRPPKQTYYERSEAYAKQVSGEIIEQIKKGSAPWMKPWKPGEQIGATNVATGKAYTGGNSLYLMSRQISEGRGADVEVIQRAGSRVLLKQGTERMVVHRPHPEPEIGKATVRDIAAFLEAVGVKP